MDFQPQVHNLFLKSEKIPFLQVSEFKYSFQVKFSQASYLNNLYQNHKDRICFSMSYMCHSNLKVILKPTWMLARCCRGLNHHLHCQYPTWAPVAVLAAPHPIQVPANMPGKTVQNCPSTWPLAPTWRRGWSSCLWITGKTNKSYFTLKDFLNINFIPQYKHTSQAHPQ